MKVTAKQLRKNKACEEELIIFEKEWPKGVEITPDALERAVELDLDLNWFANKFLPTSALQAYEKAIASAEAAYREAIASAEAAYEKARAPAEAAYREAIASAWEAYEKAIASAWEIYEKARAPAEAAYREARASAWEAYEKARAPALWQVISEYGLYADYRLWR